MSAVVERLFKARHAAPSESASPAIEPSSSTSGSATPTSPNWRAQCRTDQRLDDARRCRDHGCTHQPHERSAHASHRLRRLSLSRAMVLVMEHIRDDGCQPNGYRCAHQLHNRKAHTRLVQAAYDVRSLQNLTQRLCD